MINKDKVHTMTCMALIESRSDGKKMSKTMGFFRADYIRWEILKTIASVTVGYLIILVLITMYNSEYVVKNATRLNYRSMSLKALGIYLVILVIYSVITFFLSVYRYEKSKKKFNKYNKLLKKLENFYRDTEGEVK